MSTQQQVYDNLNIALSAKVSHCDIVFLEQDEPSVNVSFIQYPKFPDKKSVLKNGILKLVKIIMKSLDQNRVVITFDDETIMLENDENLLDPGINF